MSWIRTYIYIYMTALGITDNFTDITVLGTTDAIIDIIVLSIKEK